MRLPGLVAVMILRHPVEDSREVLSRTDLEAAFLKAIRVQRERLLNEWLRNIDEADLERFTHRLTRLRERCGCATGTWFAAVASVTSVTVAVVHGASDFTDVVVLIALCIGCVIFAGIVGKILALLIHHTRWRIERHRIMAMLRRPET
jgi:hypothetical protein